MPLRVKSRQVMDLDCSTIIRVVQTLATGMPPDKLKPRDRTTSDFATVQHDLRTIHAHYHVQSLAKHDLIRFATGS